MYCVIPLKEHPRWDSPANKQVTIPMHRRQAFYVPMASCAIQALFLAALPPPYDEVRLIRSD